MRREHCKTFGSGRKDYKFWMVITRNLQMKSGFRCFCFSVPGVLSS